jgi:hypothetical protein
LTVDVDPYRRTGERVRAVRVNGVPLDTTGARRYAVAGLWFPSEADAVSNCAPCAASGSGITLARAGGEVSDAVDVVVAYLASRPDSTVSPKTGRVRLLRPLPRSPYPFAELQPLRGVGGGPSTAGQKAPPARH